MLRFIHISDTHIGPNPDYKMYEGNTYQALQALVHHINYELPFEPDFILHTGDVASSIVDVPYTEARVQLAAELLKQLKYPVYYMAGNHDPQGRAAIRQYLMNEPPSDNRIYYDFIKDDFHFIVLDSIAEGNPKPQGFIDAEQLQWLAETCQNSTARSLVICLHHIPIYTGIPWIDNLMRITNGEELLDVLQPYQARIRGVFFGHIHRAFTAYHRGLLFSATASSFRQFFLYPDDEKARFDYQSSGGFALVMLTHEQTLVTHYTVPQA